MVNYQVLMRLFLASVLWLELSEAWSVEGANVGQQLQQIQHLQQLAQQNQPTVLPPMPPDVRPLTQETVDAQQQAAALATTLRQQQNITNASGSSPSMQPAAPNSTAQLPPIPESAAFPPNPAGQSAPTVESTIPPVGTPTNAVPEQQLVLGSAATEEVLRQQAYQSVSRSLMPMTPDQIQQLHREYNATQYAVENNPGVPPRPVASSKFVNLAPGTTPPVIRLSQGFVSSLVFVDSTGAPWPIKAYDLGNPGAFNIQWDKHSNTLMIQASKLYTYGNLAVQLDGLQTPVMLTLVPGQKAVDYRVDLRVQGLGPNAKSPPISSGLPGAANSVLLSVLDGVPPEGSTALQIQGGQGQAWLKGERLFLRTRLTLLSPSWISTMTSADGTKAYELQNASTLLVSDNGKVVQLMLKRSEES